VTQWSWTLSFLERNWKITSVGEFTQVRLSSHHRATNGDSLAKLSSKIAAKCTGVDVIASQFEEVTNDMVISSILAHF